MARSSRKSPKGAPARRSNQTATAGVNIDLGALQLVNVEGELALIIRLGRSAADPVPALDPVRRVFRVKEPPGDTVGPFLGEVTLTASGARCRAGPLYERYVDWCDAHGMERLSRVGLSRALKARGFRSVHSNGAWWIGLIMIEAPDQGDPA